MMVHLVLLLGLGLAPALTRAFPVDPFPPISPLSFHAPSNATSIASMGTRCYDIAIYNSSIPRNTVELCLAPSETRSWTISSIDIARPTSAVHVTGALVRNDTALFSPSPSSTVAYLGSVVRIISLIPTSQPKEGHVTIKASTTARIASSITSLLTLSSTASLLTSSSTASLLTSSSTASLLTSSSTASSAASSTASSTPLIASSSSSSSSSKSKSIENDATPTTSSIPTPPVPEDKTYDEDFPVAVKITVPLLTAAVGVTAAGFFRYWNSHNAPSHISIVEDIAPELITLRQTFGRFQSAPELTTQPAGHAVLDEVQAAFARFASTGNLPSTAELQALDLVAQGLTWVENNAVTLPEPGELANTAVSTVESLGNTMTSIGSHSASGDVIGPAVLKMTMQDGISALEKSTEGMPLALSEVQFLDLITKGAHDVIQTSPHASPELKANARPQAPAPAPASPEPISPPPGPPQHPETLPLPEYNNPATNPQPLSQPVEPGPAPIDEPPAHKPPTTESPSQEPAKGEPPKEEPPKEESPKEEPLKEEPPEGNPPEEESSKEQDQQNVSLPELDPYRDLGPNPYTWFNPALKDEPVYDRYHRIIKRPQEPSSAQLQKHQLPPGFDYWPARERMTWIKLKLGILKPTAEHKAWLDAKGVPYPWINHPPVMN